MIGISTIVAAALFASPGLNALEAGSVGSLSGASMSGAVASAASLVTRWGTVTSIRRSPAHNRAVGGAPNSYHLSGRAIDIARKAGIRHSEIHAALRKAGYVLIESLDEGDHSHFAFALPGTRPTIIQAGGTQVAAADIEQITCPRESTAMLRRRPDRFGDCFENSEPAPKYRPIETSF